MKCIGMFVSYEFPYHFSGTKQVYYYSPSSVCPNDDELCQCFSK